MPEAQRLYYDNVCGANALKLTREMNQVYDACRV